MKDATKLDVYFSGDKTLFLIPLYQRNYAWQKKHCERLFADLEKIHREDIRSHFFGSIVSVRASETEDDLLIIDGQQRLTTVSLLILAAINAVKDGKMELGDESEDLVKDKSNHYLYAKYRKINRKIKLRPIDRDLEAYDALFAGDPDKFVPADKSGITSNYQLFYKLIELGNLTFSDLIEAIERLQVIDIRLDSGDNPQLIFESLNSCGKDLEEADKVRNYLLMSQTAALQEEYYYKYWSKIEECTDYEPTMFIRDYLTLKRKTISSMAELYFDFKRFDEEVGMSREDLLADMLRYAKFYRQAAKGETAWLRVNRKLRQLANIGTNVNMPFFLAFLNYADENGLDEGDVYDVFDIIENYWARRIICSLPSSVMQKLMALLHGDILRIINLHAKREIPLSVSYAELLKYVLLRKQGNAVFPSDKAVDNWFPVRQIYRIPIEYRYFLFERMENENGKEIDDTIVPRMKKSEITIEHIMPQTLSPEWKTELGDEWQRISETYMHTFANLTLTGYNVNYSNHSYKDKKKGYIDRKGNKVYGFDDSAFRLSNFMKQHDSWTEKELLDRQELLLGKFKEMWPMISSAYEPLENEFETVSFEDDEYELTGRRIVAYSYCGEKHKVLTWKEMLVQVCKIIYAENHVSLLVLANRGIWFNDKPHKERSKVGENCYVYSSCSTRTKQTILNYLFSELNIAPSLLEFDIVPLSETVAEDDRDE